MYNYYIYYRVGEKHLRQQRTRDVAMCTFGSPGLWSGVQFSGGTSTALVRPWSPSPAPRQANRQTDRREDRQKF